VRKEGSLIIYSHIVDALIFKEEIFIMNGIHYLRQKDYPVSHVQFTR